MNWAVRGFYIEINWMAFTCIGNLGALAMRSSPDQSITGERHLDWRAQELRFADSVHVMRCIYCLPSK